MLFRGAATRFAGFDEGFARKLGMDARTLRQSLAAVVEYKGHEWGQGNVLGVVRFVQACDCLRSLSLLRSAGLTIRETGGLEDRGMRARPRRAQFAQSAARMEATLSGLAPGEHTLAIHAFGDLTDVPASVGPVFRCARAAPSKLAC